MKVVMTICRCKGEPVWLQEARKKQSDFGSRMCSEEDSYEEVIAAALYRIEDLLLDMASAAFSASPWDIDEEGGK